MALLGSNLVTAATAATLTKPSGATAGVALGMTCDQATILVKSTAGSDTMDVTVRIWAYYHEAAEWYSLGLLNSDDPIGETAEDTINYAEGIVGLRGATRLYANITDINGTNTAITVQAIAIPASGVS